MTDYEPAPHEKVFYRHVDTGDLGFLVERDGQKLVRLDRPAQVIEKKFEADEWQAVHDYRPLTTMQAAMIAFEADKKLAWFLQDHKAARRDWAQMKEQARIDWMNDGPKHPDRQKMFRAIMKSLKGVAG